MAIYFSKMAATMIGSKVGKLITPTVPILPISIQKGMIN